MQRRRSRSVIILSYPGRHQDEPRQSQHRTPALVVLALMRPVPLRAASDGGHSDSIECPGDL